jgi:hypothetical protein
MSTRDKSLFTSTALAVAFAVTTLAGAASAADMMVKAAPPPAPAPFFIVNDNSVSFTWYANATDPGVAGGQSTNSTLFLPGTLGGINVNNNNTSNSFSKYVGSATHFDVWAYGTNFFNVDYIKSSSKDPIQGIAGAAGAAEVYIFGRSTISGNALTGSKMFSSWLFKDISFEFGGDVNTENNFLAPEVRKLDLGASFTFNVPGTVILGVVAQKEWNHNTFLSCGANSPAGGCFGAPGQAFTGDREFNWIPRLELLISEPLGFVPWPVTWNSFTGVNFPKGTGVSTANLAAVSAPGFQGPGGALNLWTLQTSETKVEVFADNRLTFDISKMWWGKPGIWEGYVGYRYWYNKFGTDHNAGLFSSSGCNQGSAAVPGPGAGGFGCAPGTSIESTAYIGTTYHFK